MAGTDTLTCQEYPVWIDYLVVIGPPVLLLVVVWIGVELRLHRTRIKKEMQRLKKTTDQEWNDRWK